MNNTRDVILVNGRNQSDEFQTVLRTENMRVCLRSRRSQPPRCLWWAQAWTRRRRHDLLVAAVAVMVVLAAAGVGREVYVDACGRGVAAVSESDAYDATK